jgi:hypothetical protein
VRENICSVICAQGESRSQQRGRQAGGAHRPGNEQKIVISRLESCSKSFHQGRKKKMKSLWELKKRASSRPNLRIIARGRCCAPTRNLHPDRLPELKRNLNQHTAEKTFLALTNTEMEKMERDVDFFLNKTLTH